MMILNFIGHRCTMNETTDKTTIQDHTKMKAVRTIASRLDEMRRIALFMVYLSWSGLDRLESKNLLSHLVRRRRDVKRDEEPPQLHGNRIGRHQTGEVTCGVDRRQDGG